MIFRITCAALAVAASLASLVPAGAETTLRIGMTASDIPTTTGMPNNGFEGMRFLGYPVFEGLVLWDLTRSDRLATLRPGLAESYEQLPDDKKTWVFHLRHGVKFHDGTDFNADAVIWNLDRYFKNGSPQFEPPAAGLSRARVPILAAYRKIDDYTVAIETKQPASYFPYMAVYLLFASPASFEKAGHDWSKVALLPAAGTGPFRITKVVPREAAELARFDGYWDKGHMAKVDVIRLLPIPESNARLAALRSGQVDWIEAPAPDAVASLKQAGFKIVTNAYPHNWTWHLSRAEGSPWNDIRVRKAANLAIDRDGMKEMLSGLMIPAQGFLPPGHQWFGHPGFKVTYDPAQAKKLLAEAGYGPNKPVTTKVLISASGSGQMQPLPMNEVIQQNLAEVGIKVDFEVVEWNTMINIWRAGAKHDSARGTTAMNFSYFIQDPFTAFIRHLQCNLAPPAGTNWGYYCDPEMDKLLGEVRAAFDPAEQTKVLQKVHEKYVDDALFLMVTHDVNPRAMSPKVKGFVQAQNWFQDFSPITMTK